MAAVVSVGFAYCLSATGCTTAPIRRQSPQQQQVTALVQQLSTFRQSDLIIFPDGRVWYVRDVQGGSMEVVGWIGDNTKSEDINSFALADHDFTIVRQLARMPRSGRTIGTSTSNSQKRLLGDALIEIIG